MGETQHTPTPWSVHIHQGSLFGEAHISGPHHCAIAYIGFGTQTDDHYVRGEEANANAHFIVAAVNSHATLTAERDAALSELEKLRAEAEWRPIESAPKDGTPISITTPYSFGDDGKMHGGVPVVAVWTVTKIFTGWALPDLSGAYGYLTSAATHWLPLPSPPKDPAHD